MAKKESEPDTVRVLFTQDYTVQDGTDTTYERGGVYEMAEASARHFQNRGVAKPAEEEKESKPKPVETREVEEEKPKRGRQAAGELDAVPARYQEPLKAAGLDSVDKINAHVAEHGTLKDVEGIGEAGDEAIQKGIKSSRR